MIVRGCLGNEYGHRDILFEKSFYLKNSIWSLAYPATILKKDEVVSKTKELFEMVAGKQNTSAFWGKLLQVTDRLEDEQKRNAEIAAELKRQRAEANSRSRAGSSKNVTEEADEDGADVPDQIVIGNEDDAAGKNGDPSTLASQTKGSKGKGKPKASPKPKAKANATSKVGS